VSGFSVSCIPEGALTHAVCTWHILKTEGSEPDWQVSEPVRHRELPMWNVKGINSVHCRQQKRPRAVGMQQQYATEQSEILRGNQHESSRLCAQLGESVAKYARPVSRSTAQRQTWLHCHLAARPSQHLSCPNPAAWSQTAMPSAQHVHSSPRYRPFLHPAPFPM